ncbi:TauD/TfdA family dioxygenase (plasmid) [Embleya sp. NBC_00888]|uniref:2-trimethylaminoethylphosphonate dioxygenase n=1 Tax=Embleya sp. NBC_00888 TaxID=2975960 RepID=UPI002F908AD6|nr:TauD/TfdA family dioxygenase [Embleya sp. NBC_00888]
MATAPDIGDLPAVWLRDNCPCPLCRDPRTGQKLFQITDLPLDPSVAEVREHGSDVEIVWAPDGHRSVYARTWLHAPAEPDPRSEDGKSLWEAAEMHAPRFEFAWNDYTDDPAPALTAVQRLGLALLRGVPCVEGQVLAVAATFGFVRETNYGRLFDVRVEDRPNNLAFTSARITPHTDNPYRDPVPTLQLLHCLANEAAGGDSGFVDGFRAAALLRAEHPDAYQALVRTSVPFEFRDTRTRLRAHRPIIGADDTGRIREVRFNNRSMGTLRLSADDLAEFYTAYRAFAEVLARPELMLTRRLEPGDCVVFDNTRVLHARTAFDGAGRRHLQGCYADLDGLASTLGVLDRTMGQAS